MVEIDKRARRPQSRSQFSPANDFSGTFEQDPEHLEWLILQLDPQAVFAQLSSVKVRFKCAESNDCCRALHAKVEILTPSRL
jgi:hypothetical protein